MHPAFNKVQKMAQKCAVNAQRMRRECAGNAFAKKGPLIRKIGPLPPPNTSAGYNNSNVRTLVHRLRGGGSPWPFNLSASVPPKEPEPRGGKTGYLRDTAPRSHRASDLGLRVYNALQGLLGIQCLQVSPGLYGCCLGVVLIMTRPAGRQRWQNEHTNLPNHSLVAKEMALIHQRK